MNDDVSDDIYWDVANGFLTDNQDGSFTDTETGDIIDGQGNWLANIYSDVSNSAGGVNSNSDDSAAPADVRFDEFGNISTFEAMDSQGHEVWQGVSPDGQVYHVYYDQDGKPVAYTNEFYQAFPTSSISQGTATPRSSTMGGSAGGMQGGGLSLGGGGNNDALKKISDAITLLSQKYATAQASGASASTLGAYQSAIANLQNSRNSLGGISTTTWLIIGAAAVAGMFALRGRRAA